MDDDTYRENNNVYNTTDGEIKIKTEVKIEEIESEYEPDILILDHKCSCVLHHNSVNTRRKSDLYKDHVIKEELVIGPEVIQDNSSNDTKTIKTESVKPDAELFNCKKCNTNFLRKPQLLKHCKTAHSAFQCKYCNMTFTLRPNMLRHQRLICKMNNVKRPKLVRSKYECNECDKKFSQRQSLIHHLKMLHMFKVGCKFCGKTCSTRANLKRHETYFCELNQSKNKNNKKVKYGMYLNPFICDYCNNEYAHKKTLIDHIRKHTGMVPNAKFACHLCDKAYTKKHNLTCHINSQHLNVKLYSCKDCDLKFSWKWSLLSHLKRHHGD